MQNQYERLLTSAKVMADCGSEGSEEQLGAHGEYCIHSWNLAGDESL